MWYNLIYGKEFEKSLKERYKKAFMKKKYRYRNSITGRLTTQAYAEANSDTTEREQVRPASKVNKRIKEINLILIEEGNTHEQIEQFWKDILDIAEVRSNG